MRRSRLLVLVGLVALASAQASTSPERIRVTSPREQFGAAIGDDYFLATYAELEAYWQRLDRESERLALVDIGRTEEGRTQWMAVVTAPGNHARLARYRDISRRLAYADGLSDAEARALAAEGKTIVCIAGGLHANEVLGAQQLIQAAYELASRSDPETERILRDVIVLLVHANPDGHERVAGAYMQEEMPRRRVLGPPARPYQKYVGHDNNRDFYMGTQAETVNVSRVLFSDWLPQIVYDHHQAPLSNAVMYAPPFGGPVNGRIDPRVTSGVEAIGEAIHRRLAAEGKVELRAGDDESYSMWWNGGLRTTPYFHNQIGILTETAGSPTPGEGPPFRVALDYAMSASRAVLEIASRDRARWVYGAYRMGRDAIEQETSDSPRAYVLPANQPDFLTATKFVNALLKAGVIVHRARAPFVAGGRSYPAGSYVVEAAQAFRPHVLDMFEPQDQPDTLEEADGHPRPYDSTGWTLAFQMGVTFDRVVDRVSASLERLAPVVPPPPGDVREAADTRGFVLSHRQNDAVIAVNRLLASGADVFWLDSASIYITRTPSAAAVARQAARDIGLTFAGVPDAPAPGAVRLRRPRIALVDRRDGWSTSGWLRWILERSEFRFDVRYADTLSGALDGYDIVILPGEAVVGRAGPGELDKAVALPALKRFVERGGTLLATGASAAIGRQLGVPVAYLSRFGESPYDIRGSVLRVAVDPAVPVGYGFEEAVDVFFNNGPVFRLTGDARAQGVRPIAWFDRPLPLRSGWAIGQRHLQGGLAGIDAPLGRGRVILFGPEIAFRAQAHGTFKFLFNSIYYATLRR